MPSSPEPARLTFSDLQLAVDLGFWEELRRQKLTEWKLEEPSAPLHGTVRVNVSDRVLLTPPSLVHLSSTSLRTPAAAALAHDTFADVVDVHVQGIVKNFNFAEGLSALDARNALFSCVAQFILMPAMTHYTTEDDEARAWGNIPFCTLSMFTFIDAKSYHFYHREAFPTVALEGSICRNEPNAEAALSPDAAHAVHLHGVELLREHPERALNPFLTVYAPGAAPRFCAATPSALASSTEEDAVAVLCFYDLSDSAESLCLPARNLITCLRLATPSLTSLNVYALRPGGVEKSVLFCLTFDAVDRTLVDALQSRLAHAAPDEIQQVRWKEEFPQLKVSGWRKKKVELLDLGAFIDPVQRADSDARFNLELMKWRVLPSLELTRIAESKVLLLGTGTLGCNVARNLMMWGVRHLTLVDRGRVSFSNLARQSLFSFDAAKENKLKVEAAAEALRAIIPTTTAHPVPLTIHMPGHRIDESKATEALADIHRLEELIAACDVVFLLTDSREARWMPTIIAAACGTPVVNVALGFDTYVVMRHGVPRAGKSQSNVVDKEDGALPAHRALGCYFCSDVVAPTDSLSFRALDEQCTVTRPAVSAIASAVAVELVAELYQHPAGFCCPPFRESSTEDTDAGKCRLGVLPQQIRGSVFSHTMHHLCGERNPFCTACSDKLLDAYAEGGAEFLLRCVNAPLFIEEVCGVKQLKDKWETDAKEMCWSSDDDGWADS